ncbi:MAG: GNAT family N-acetyltransferase [Clostridiales bacterium]|nr:GNAT family N-acetyltransferase [Clostridiales bacterium]
MVCELHDTAKAEALFKGMEDSLILSCLQNMMDGKIYVTDPEDPRSAMAYVAGFAFYAGSPDEELAAFTPNGSFEMVAQDEAWARLLKDKHPCAVTYTRYAIKKDTKFDRKKLEALAASLPSGYEIRRIDADLYRVCLQNELFECCVSNFASERDYLEHGRGFAVMKDGDMVSSASSYSVYREGVEVEIDTVEEERRRGLASAVAAKLILSCLDDGLYPSWDAANMESVRLAQKLGYELKGEYKTLFVRDVCDHAVDPGK